MPVFKKLSFYLCIYLCQFIIIDLIIYYLQFDINVMKPLFYYVEGDYHYDNKIEVFERVENPQIIYRPKSNIRANCQNCVHKKDFELNHTTITTNHRNGRVVTGSSPKDHQTLFWIGGSYSFGISVSDELTIQSQLQHFFHKKNYPLSIWNNSANAYVLHQKVAVAEDLVKKFGMPKVFVFQDSNGGRRAFMYNEQDFLSYFKKDKTLYLENYPNYFNFPLHDFFATSSALYRLGLAFIFRQIHKNEFPRCNKETWECWNIIFNRLFDKYPNELALKTFNKFAAQYSQSATIIMFNPLQKNCAHHSAQYEIRHHTHYKDIVICNNRPDGEEYNTEIHPPSYVYRWYAKIYTQAFDDILKDLKFTL